MYIEVIAFLRRHSVSLFLSATVREGFVRLFEVLWSFGQELSRKLRASSGNGPFRSEILPALTNVVCLSTLGPRTCVSFPHTHTHSPLTPPTHPATHFLCLCVSNKMKNIWTLAKSAQGYQFPKCLRCVYACIVKSN